MDASGLRGLDDKSLVHQELSWEFELTRATLDHRGEKLVDVSRLKKLRRAIARSRTVQREREATQGVGNGSLRRLYRPSFQHQAPTVASATAEQSDGGFLSNIAGRFGLASDEG
jgi:ribosomal protein L29